MITVPLKRWCRAYALQGDGAIAWESPVHNYSAGTKFPVTLLGVLARTRTVTNLTFPVATTFSAMLSDLSLVIRLVCMGKF